jgi:hypothetical protein
VIFILIQNSFGQKLWRLSGLVKLPSLMELSTGRSDVAVGLIDGPVAVTHPGLAGNIREAPGTVAACSQATSTACLHGTFVAGMLSAKRGSIAPAVCPHRTLLVRPVIAEAAQTLPSGFNDADKIVGSYIDGGGTEHSFVLYGGNFGTFAIAGAAQTYAVDTDNVGHIVGSYFDTGGTLHGFLWYRGFSLYDIVAFPGAVRTEPLGIYNQLNLVGRYSKSGPPFVWEGFVMKGSPRLSGSYSSITVPGAVGTHALDINVNGVIVGYYEDSANLQHSFVLSEGNFSTIDFPGALAGSTWAGGLNDAGQIVGQYTDPLGGGTLGFLATPIIEAAAAQKEPIRFAFGQAKEAERAIAGLTQAGDTPWAAQALSEAQQKKKASDNKQAA